jgi:hypothetical protein
MAESSWKPFPESCPECGEDSEIFTTSGGYGYDADPVRCADPSCGARGYWSGDSESEFYVNWDV